MNGDSGLSQTKWISKLSLKVSVCIDTWFKSKGQCEFLKEEKVGRQAVGCFDGEVEGLKLCPIEDV